MVSPADIEAYIRDGLACDFLRVDGDGQHFDAVIVSGRFRGRSRVEQHQLVYAALGDRMRAEVHALSMRTLTPEEWAAQQG